MTQPKKFRDDFQTTQSDLLKHNGKSFKVLRELSGEEIDIEEVGRMYELKLSTDEIILAHEDEILNPELRLVTYVSVWDGGSEISTVANYDPATGLVHDILMAEGVDADGDEVQQLDEEYILLPEGDKLRILEDDGDYRAFTEDDWPLS